MSQGTVFFDSHTNSLSCQGDWDMAHLAELAVLLEKTPWPQTGRLIIQGQDINKMDTGGAWLINDWKNKLEAQGLEVEICKFSPSGQMLLAMVEKKTKEKTKLIKPPILSHIAVLGKNTVAQLVEVQDFFTFIGQLSIEALNMIFYPARWRLQALASVIYRNGYQALPIVALLSFMIGVVLAYQMGMQLRNYGANIYIVDLQGLSVLREFGPLLTAIIVAGRTGSAFTAQLGTMKINQEIDALNTLGVTPAELLILPRILGLFIALPLITIWADLFGVLGGMMMSHNMLGITSYDFLHRFEKVIPVRALLVGLGKTPVFALIIASIGCFLGMRVERNADSVGYNTTKSVVLAIFFIIVADAVFSVIFSKLKL